MSSSEHHQDPELASLLAELPVAEHGPEFWRELEVELRRTSGSGQPVSNGSGPAMPGPTVEMIDTPHSAHSATGLAPDEVIPIDRRRRGVGAVVLAGLTAAAAVLVAVAITVSLRDRSTIESPPVGPDPTTATDVDGTPESGLPKADDDGASPGPAPVVDYVEAGDVEVIGQGGFVGFTPDGSRAIVLDDHPFGETGSEGAPLLTLWSVSLDGVERSLALPEEVTIETGTDPSGFELGPDGHMAWIEHCDGVLCGLRTARLAENGLIDQVVDVALPDVADGDESLDISDVAVGPEGGVYLSVGDRLGRVDPGGSTLNVEPDVAADAVAVTRAGGTGELVPGTLVRADGDRLLVGTDDDLLVSLAVPVSSLGPSPTGDLVALDEAGDLFIVDVAAAQSRAIGYRLSPEAFVSRLGVTPDGRHVVVAADGKVQLVSLDGELLHEVLLQGGIVDNPHLSPDGLALGYSVRSPGEPPTSYLQRFALLPEEGERPDGEGASAEAGPAPVEAGALAEFTTTFACCQPRVTNIERIAELTDGAVIPAGGTFSLNDQVGRRTIEAGFVADGAIVQGLLEPMVGGGVSQYATTLFNAALFAGLDFDEYQSNSLYISRYPRGRDASLGFPRPDLVIRNETDADVVIHNAVTDTSVTVELRSSASAPVLVEIGEAVRSDQDQCSVYTTARTRTFPDGRVVEDSVFAVYRPAEGLDCNGN